MVAGRVTAAQWNHPELEPLSYRETANLDGSAALYPDVF